MKIGIQPFEKIHAHAKDTGSSRIRVYWLTKHWPEAEVFRYGQKYDTVIFQKAYIHRAFMDVFPGLKVLDVCDPDWKQEVRFVEVLQKVDGVVTSTETLAEYIRKMTDKPVLCIPDRHDPTWYGTPKVNTETRAKSVAWFGYAGNVLGLRLMIPTLKKLDLEVTCYSDRETSDMIGCNFVKYNPATINEQLKRHDFLVLPPDTFNQDFRYKSNNKTVSGWYLGMAVAQTRKDIMRYLEGTERIKEVEARQKEIKDNWGIEHSVKQWKGFLHELEKTSKAKTA